MLVVVGGLPGTGKSTLAASIGHTLGAPVIGRDVVEAAMWRTGIRTEQGSWRAANELLRTLAAAFLVQGLDVVLDSVFGDPEVRDGVRAVAALHRSAFRLVECTCSDLTLHRSRIEGRARNIDGWYELAWSDVEGTRARYAPWGDDRIVLDAVRPFDENLALAMSYLTMP